MPEPTINDLLPGVDLSSFGVDVQPGISLLEQLITAAVQKYIADLSNKETMTQFETQLGANPQNFVAQQLYKRALEEKGFTPFTGASASDADIQAAYQQALGFNPVGRMGQYNPGSPDAVDAQKAMQANNKLLSDYMLRVTAGLEPYDQTKAQRLASGEGYGRFGVTIPRTGEFTRQNWQNMSEQDFGILSSFLNAGTQDPSGSGQYFSVQPDEYFKQVEKGFIPTLNYTGPTRVQS